MTAPKLDLEQEAQRVERLASEEVVDFLLEHEWLRVGSAEERVILEHNVADAMRRAEGGGVLATLRRVQEATRAERDDEWRCLVHHMTLMLSDFGQHESECRCSGDQAQHAADCKDCDCGLADAIGFGVEQSGISLEPEPMTPEEETRLHEVGMRAVREAIRRALLGKGEATR